MGNLEWIRTELEGLPGNISCVFQNLRTGERFAYRPEAKQYPASVIKLYVMAALYDGFARKDFHPGDRIPVRREDCVPSCGVLTYLDDGKEVSLRDLAELMIIVSDNTACNVLMDFLSIPRIQAYVESLGLRGTFVGRKMFDMELEARGIRNASTAADTAWLLERIWRGELTSPEASARMLETLRHQRLNGKIPFRLHTLADAPVIAHKTGEDDGTTHDVAIIEGAEPLLLCLMGNDTDVPAFERKMGDIAWRLYHQFAGK